MPRIGPLFHFLKPQTDPDPPRTEKVVAAFKALGQGGKAIVDSALLTPGTLPLILRISPARPVGDVRSVVFLTEVDVSAHAIERHKGKGESRPPLPVRDRRSGTESPRPLDRGWTAYGLRLR